jgi:hypothetical protein
VLAISGIGVGTDIHVDYKQLSFVHLTIGVSDIGLGSPDALDLGTGQNNPCNKFFKKKIFE